LAFIALSASESGFPTERLMEGALVAGDASDTATPVARQAANTIPT
jgi:hypothetical protein